MNERWEYDVTGVNDDLFIRGKVPMTKSEVRAVSLSKMKLEKGMAVLDIGAGTGSVSIECALRGCRVTAVEKNPEGVDLIRQNAEVFGVDEIEAVEGTAPMAFPKKTVFDRAFIGGSGGKLEGIFRYLDSNLADEGILVANTITIENTSKLMAVLKHYKYECIEAVQLNVSRSKAVGSVHMMIAENPITVISAVKANRKEGSEDNGKSNVHRSRTWRPRTHNNKG